MEPHVGGELMRRASSSLLRSQSDGRLVELTRGGQDEAFEAIVARYRRPLLRYCRNFLPPDQAEDTVQETLTRAYTALTRNGHAEIQLRPWLYRIAHNSSITALRERAPGYELLGEDHEGAETPHHAFERSERLRDLIASVNALPEQQRSAILLRALEGRSYDDIAAELGMSRGAAHQLVHRARLKLRAAAAAFVPPGVVSRLPWGSTGHSGVQRAAELGTAGGTTAVVGKVCATVLVAGAVVGGAVEGPHLGRDAGSGASTGDRGVWSLHAGVAPGAGFAPRGSAGAGERDSSGSSSGGVRHGGAAGGQPGHVSQGRGPGGSGSSGPGDGGSASGSSGSGSGGHSPASFTAGGASSSGPGGGGAGSSGSESGPGGSGSGSSTRTSSSGRGGSGFSGGGSSSGHGSGSSDSGSSSSPDDSSGSDDDSRDADEIELKDASEPDDD